MPASVSMGSRPTRLCAVEADATDLSTFIRVRANSWPLRLSDRLLLTDSLVLLHRPTLPLDKLRCQLAAVVAPSQTLIEFLCVCHVNRVRSAVARVADVKFAVGQLLRRCAAQDENRFLRSASL